MFIGIASSTNISYAAGTISGMVIKDGIILTLLVWVIMTKLMKRDAWKWYDWLNTLAYTTVISRVIYVFIVG